MSSYVLDASAVLALLNNEPGADEVAAVLDDAAICTVNVCEVIGKLVDSGMSREDAQASIELLRIETIAFDTERAYAAGALIAQTRKLGLSLGDRCCLSLGLAKRNIVMTAERSWAKLTSGPRIKLIR